MDLDAIDLRILKVLQENSRVSNRELADQVGLSPSPCLRRVRMLEKSGVIRGYTASVNPNAVGLNLSIFISVKLERQTDEALAAFRTKVAECPEVMGCFLMSGVYDYLLHVVTAGTESFDAFLRKKLTKIPGVARIESSFVLETVISRSALPYKSSAD